jgi:hypothetical protein
MNKKLCSGDVYSRLGRRSGRVQDPPLLVLNPKSEAPNPKQYQNAKHQCSKRLGFCILIFGFV